MVLRKMKRFCIFLLILGVVYFDSAECMSEAQVKNAIKLVRQMCQPKFKITNAQIDNMHKGIFEDDNKQACYMNCGLNSLKFMKNGKMDYEYATGQLKSLPDTWRGPLNHALDACRDSTTSNDKCEAAYQLAKCMYNAEPDFYILP